MVVIGSYFYHNRPNYIEQPTGHAGGGPGAVVIKVPTWIVRDRGVEPHSGLQVSKNKMFLSRSLVEIQYCGEPS